jgi:hypothetical protein
MLLVSQAAAYNNNHKLILSRSVAIPARSLRAAKVASTSRGKRLVSTPISHRITEYFERTIASNLSQSSTYTSTAPTRRRKIADLSIDSSQTTIHSFFSASKRQRLADSLSISRDPDYWTHPDDFANSQSGELLAANRASSSPPRKLKQPKLNFGSTSTLSLTTTANSALQSGPLPQADFTHRPLKQSDVDNCTYKSSELNVDSQNLFFAMQEKDQRKKTKKLKKNLKRKRLDTQPSDTPLSSPLTRGPP